MKVNRHRRTSEILYDIAASCEDGKISVRDFAGKMGNRAFALMILVFSLPNSVPVPGIPGFSTITGLPILFLAAQMVLGRQQIWLPRFLAELQFSAGVLKKVLLKALPYVVKFEKYLKPRWPVVYSPLGERLIGLFILALSAILVLPIPGGNFLPGVCISIFAIAFLEKDGLCAVGGMVVVALSFRLMLKLIVAMFHFFI